MFLVGGAPEKELPFTPERWWAVHTCARELLESFVEVIGRQPLLAANIEEGPLSGHPMRGLR